MHRASDANAVAFRDETTTRRSRPVAKAIRSFSFIFRFESRRSALYFAICFVISRGGPNARRKTPKALLRSHETESVRCFRVTPIETAKICETFLTPLNTPIAVKEKKKTKKKNNHAPKYTHVYKSRIIVFRETFSDFLYLN